MKTVMVFGTFDVIHAGHLDLLTRAKKRGDWLIVVIARDITVERVKGHVAHHTEAERKRLVGAIRMVDQVVLGSKTDMYAVIKKMQPDVICLGYDQEAFVDKLNHALTERGLLTTTVVRLPAYAPERCKTTQILRNDIRDL